MDVWSYRKLKLEEVADSTDVSHGGEKFNSFVSPVNLKTMHQKLNWITSKTIF